MKCSVDGCRRDRFKIRNIDRYCWIHYQIYDAYFARHSDDPDYESFLIEGTQLKPAPGEGDSAILLAGVARVELENLGKK
jgi:hypothetical protein